MTSVELPVLSPSRLRALALLADESAHPVQIAGVVKSDPALTTLVLRAANSALSFPRERITRIEQAIVRIGLRETRQIVGAAAVRESYRLVEMAGLHEGETWRHAILTAVLAEGLTTLEPNTQGVRDSAFTVGLLHDVGRLQQASQHPLLYRRVVEAVSEGADPIEEERRNFDIDHAALGGEIGRACRFGSEIESAIATHHDPDPGDRLALAVTRARDLAHALGVGDGLVPALEEPPALAPDEKRVVDSLGGASALLRHVESFRQTISRAA